MSKAEKKGFDPQELMDTLQNLDFENVGGWPLPIKLGAALLVFIGVLAVLVHRMRIEDDGFLRQAVVFL